MLSIILVSRTRRALGPSLFFIENSKDLYCLYKSTDLLQPYNQRYRCFDMNWHTSARTHTGDSSLYNNGHYIYLDNMNISSYYFKPGFAYGGSCLPKDLRGFQTLAHDLYVKVPVIDSIDETNEIQIQRAVKTIFRYWNKKLGFLGLSFKAGTDDLRNSPAVAVIESLLGKGCDIRIYDKNINLSMLTGTNKEYIDSRIPHLSTLLTSDPNEIINDSNVIVINTKEPEFFDLVKDIQDKIIIDFVRLDESLLSKGNYSGINW